MMRRSHGRNGLAPAAIGFAAVLGLAACGGSLFRSKLPPPAVYQLSIGSGRAPAAAVPAGTPIPADLSVLRPRVRTGLDSDRIAVLYPDRRLDYLADARWSGPVEAVMLDLTLQAFRRDANLRSVHAEDSAFVGAYLLSIDVTDFQAEYAAGAGGSDTEAAGAAAPVVHVHLLASLGTAADRRMLGRFEADARRPASANRVTAIVEAYDQAVEEALAQVVSASADALGRSAEHR